MLDWNAIRQENGPLVWSVTMRILRHQEDALDCMQEVFIEAIERAGQKPIDNWAGLLRWLATKRAIDMLRKRRGLPVETKVEPRSNSSSPYQDLAYSELIERVRTELAVLPIPQAQAFWLVCVEEESYDGAAEVMETDRNHIGVLVHRSRKHLKSVLSDVERATLE